MARQRPGDGSHILCDGSALSKENINFSLSPRLAPSLKILTELCPTLNTCHLVNTQTHISTKIENVLFVILRKIPNIYAWSDSIMIKRGSCSLSFKLARAGPTHQHLISWYLIKNLSKRLIILAPGRRDRSRQEEGSWSQVMPTGLSLIMFLCAPIIFAGFYLILKLFTLSMEKWFSGFLRITLLPNIDNWS